MSLFAVVTFEITKADAAGELAFRDRLKALGLADRLPTPTGDQLLPRGTVAGKLESPADQRTMRNRLVNACRRALQESKVEGRIFAIVSDHCPWGIAKS